MKKFAITSGLITMAGFASTAVLAHQMATVEPQTKVVITKPVEQQAAYQNNSSIAITGVVSHTARDGFQLSYAPNQTVFVEVDDWDSYDESQSFRAGEKVTVYGNIDHDLYESRKVEAESVYAHDRYVYYMANGADEEDYRNSYRTISAINDIQDVNDGSWVSVMGSVNSISGDQMRVQFGDTEVAVNTDLLGYNPFDTQGFQRIDAGDNIYVYGKMDANFFDGRVLNATRVITVEG